MPYLSAIVFMCGFSAGQLFQNGFALLRLLSNWCFIDTDNKESFSSRKFYCIYYVLFYVGALLLVITGGCASPCWRD